MSIGSFNDLRKVIRSILLEGNEKSSDDFGSDPDMYRGPDGKAYKVFRASDFKNLEINMPDLQGIQMSAEDLGKETSTTGLYAVPADKVIANYSAYGVKTPSRTFSSIPVPHPSGGADRPHWGVDLTLDKSVSPTAGVPALAIAPGTVKIGQLAASANPDSGPGNYVTLKLDGGGIVTYMHLNSITSGLNNNAHVDQGAEIGTLGETGGAYGPHLHFEWHDSYPLNGSTAKNPLEKLNSPNYIFPFAVPNIKNQ